MKEILRLTMTFRSGIKKLCTRKQGFHVVLMSRLESHLTKVSLTIHVFGDSFLLQRSPDNSLKEYAKILCKLSRLFKLSIHWSHWGSIQLCDSRLNNLSGMCELAMVKLSRLYCILLNFTWKMTAEKSLLIINSMLVQISYMDYHLTCQSWPEIF